ncbi:hypothetical protein F0562_003983 [Nyssa sinensis]|uniref:Uncharacterized protein n=1 Tax=Nyssa sinensis TaxID=561372 RepID=A0A5J5BY25_9ASTE|nr:hypothetical protein F0562_003983 [Nyssa sinensis]
MKQMGVETEGGFAKLKQGTPPPLPPPLPPMFWVATKAVVKTTIMGSVTNQEIAKFWSQKHMEEEDHLLAAIKAAARIRACNLSEDDYKRFEESLKEDDNKKENNATTKTSDEDTTEIRVGIKDWWTKSKYAFLNQPAIESMDTNKPRTSTYIPNFCNYKPPPSPPTSFGIF